MPPRKKARVTKVKSTAVKATHEPNHDQDGVRQSGRALRGRRGSLKDLPEMPVDILNEIFSYLHPKDLLNLARTSKAFREFLLNKRNVHMWRIARKRDQDIPPIPPFLSEPAYAHLLFSAYCHACGKGPVHKVMWIWFKRYCQACLPKQRKNLRPDTLNRLRDKKTLETFGWKFTDILNVIDFREGRYYRVQSNIYHEPQLQQFLQEWNAAESAEARAKVYRRQKAAVVQRQAHAKVLERWWKRRQDDRSGELDEIRQQRWIDICNRLEQAGWGDEIRRLRGTSDGRAELSRVRILHQPVKLTDKAYETVLRELDSLLNQTRNAMQTERRLDTLTKNLKLLDQAIKAHYVQIPRKPRMLCRPRVGDFVFEPEVEALLTGPTADDLKVDDFAAIVPTLGSRWEEPIREELRNKVRSQVAGISSDIDPLELAVACFDCPRFGCYSLEQPMRYPGILFHGCLRECRHSYTPYALDVRTVTDKMRHPALQFTCSLVTDNLISDAKQLLTVLGMSPATTTCHELVQKDLKLRRKKCQCAPNGNDCGLYTFDVALMLSKKKRDFDQWRLATPEELQAISLLGVQSRLTPGNTGYRTSWHCALCLEWAGCHDEVTKHLRNEHQLHDVNQCVEDGTIFMSPCRTHADPPLPLPHLSG
ncbi:hypothetical protein BN946_scf185033.g16 [Trametes cinnabarina]|uniref:F-box domain-containing protein n=1 Tax=Pycnoporus cinnabarinus TaxID=5643 RepID=A0A060SX94_PYCCI|nr:hypothetical protein BN946_scf185033.g16 [Trametes cinnabarina]